MREVEVGGNRYRAGRLDLWDQLHVARKVAPLYAKVLQAGGAAARGEVSVEAVFGPMAVGLSAMSREDVEALFKTCLGACERHQKLDGGGEAWAPVAARGQVMFGDVDAEVASRLTVEVVKENLGNFFQGLLESFAGGPSPKASA